MARSRLLLPLLLCLAVAPTALAAGEMPRFFTEVVFLVVVSAGMAYACHRLGLVPILGFLFAGVVLNATGLVEEPELVEAVAEMGVVLLLFTIGIEFSLEELGRLSRLIFVGGGLQVVLTFGLVMAILGGLGVDWRAALFTGLLVSLSSTAIVMKLLESRGETRTVPGQLSLGMLIFQDLAVVAMVILVPMLGVSEGGGDSGAAGVLTALGSAAAIIAAVLLLARRVMPKLLEALARTCSQEVFLLGVIAICFGTAFVTGLAGVSLSLGAFLAGLLVSESRFGSQALGDILPLQILFSAAFFVSVGLLLDVGFLLRNLPLVLAVVAAVLVLKAAVTAASARMLGYAAGPSLAAGLMLAQVGEFSFVLERAGREVGLFPAGMEGSGGQTFIAATVLLMALTPFLAQAGAAVEKRLRPKEPATQPVAEFAGHDLEDHVMILGYGRTGRLLAHRLAADGHPHLVLTLSPTGASEAEAAGIRVLRGDYTKLSVLRQGGLQRARLAVFGDDTLSTAERTVQLLKASRPSLPILLKVVLEEDARTLARHGVAFAVSEEGHSTQALWQELQRHLGITPSDEAADLALPAPDLPSFQLREEQRTSTACSHQDQTRLVTPDATDVCPECVAAGDRWVHLRLCLTCGHVGCCDTSPNRHATRHFETTGHPIVCSLESGEDWAWCYVDEAILD